MVEREDITRLLLSVNNVVVSFLSRNIDILIILYIPIGIFLVFITSRLKRILFDNVLGILVTRGFDRRKISLYSLISLILIFLITLFIVDFIMLYVLHISTEIILSYSLAMIIVFTITYSISGHSGSRLSRWLFYIFSVLFIVYVAMGYLRLSMIIIAFSYKYLLVPLTIIMSLLPLYAIFLPYMLYTLYSKALSFIEKKLVEHVYMLRSMQKYGIILFTSIYSLVIIILISLSPITITYNHISADPNYVSALGYEKLTELGILDNWMSSQYILFGSIFVVTFLINLFLFLRDIYKLLRYAEIRGLDKEFIYKRIFGSSMFMLILIVLFISIMFLVLILFFDAHIGLFYSAVRTGIVYDPNTHVPRVTIEEIFVPKHLWEGLI